MTRILFWNIQQFNAGGNLANRLNFIQNLFNHLLPDIFIIVEVTSLNDPVVLDGQLFQISANAAGAVLNRLRTVGLGAPLGPDWCLVPPLSSGLGRLREAVAVFYNSAHLEFKGPYVWGHPVGEHGALERSINPNLPGGVALDNYPGYTVTAVPGPLGNYDFLPNRPGIGPAAPPAGPVNENQCAGQYEFFTAGAAPARIYFPNGGFLEPNKYRAPFLTIFREVAAPNRFIKLFSLHTTPGRTAEDAIRQLHNIPELVPGAGEVVVVAGDFNVDLYGAAAGAYNNFMFTAAGALQNFPLLSPLDPAHPPPPINVMQARKPYCLTHLLPVNIATPYNSALGGNVSPTSNIYPRYGFMGSTNGAGVGVNDSGALDNIFVRYNAPALAPGNHNTTVINPIIGSPYAAPAAPLPPGYSPGLLGVLNFPQDPAMAGGGGGAGALPAGGVRAHEPAAELGLRTALNLLGPPPPVLPPQIQATLNAVNVILAAGGVTDEIAAAQGAVALAPAIPPYLTVTRAITNSPAGIAKAKAAATAAVADILCRTALPPAPPLPPVPPIAPPIAQALALQAAGAVWNSAAGDVRAAVVAALAGTAAAGRSNNIGLIAALAVVTIEWIISPFSWPGAAGAPGVVVPRLAQLASCSAAVTTAVYLCALPPAGLPAGLPTPLQTFLARQRIRTALTNLVAPTDATLAGTAARTAFEELRIMYGWPAGPATDVATAAAAAAAAGMDSFFAKVNFQNAYQNIYAISDHLPLVADV